MEKQTDLPHRIVAPRFSYVKYDADVAELQAQIKQKFEELEKLLNDVLPQGRPLSLCMTALEESYMWTGKTLRDAQVARNGKIAEQPERNNE